MSIRPVHWHEGMFLRPHHFQSAQRHLTAAAGRGDKWDLHYNWGLRSIEIDQDALTNHRLVVRALQARMRDGTLISVPEDAAALERNDLREAMGRESAVTVLLAVPMLQEGRANVGTGARDEPARFSFDSLQLEDENTGTNPQPVEFRRLNLRLLFENEDQSGYEVLPIARVEKSARAEALPQLQPAYIPPVLACDGWKPLQADILQVVHDRLGTKLSLLASQVQSRGITFGSSAGGDALIFGQLNVLNEAVALLGVMAFAQGVHPLPAYLELCRLVGQLSIFGDTRRTPELPRYDHDDLGGCFHRVKNYLDALLDKIIEPDYKERPFEGVALRMQVALEPAWLESVWQMYVGVQTALPAEECVKLLKTSSRMDMKIGSGGNVDTIFQRGQAGLEFSHAPNPPRALPATAGLVYFQVNRDSQQEEWSRVKKEYSLALRLNETRVVGEIQGQRILTVRTSGQTTTLQFTLYVVREAK